MQLKNHLEIYKLLPKTNCKKCGFPTCMAFAVAVFKGEKKLADCPHLDRDLLAQYDVKVEKRVTIEEQQELLLKQLQQKIPQVNFSAVATKLGATLAGEKLIIKVLGRDFTVDAQGNIASGCHVIPWVTIPLLDYIITGAGIPIAGIWVPFRELKKGSVRNPLFAQRCEKPLKQMADDNTDLFEDILSIFGGKPAQTNFSADISMALYPLPKVPMLISYTRARHEIPSRLNLFFDATAEEQMSVDSLHMITSGFVTMLEKITHRHG